MASGYSFDKTAFDSNVLLKTLEYNPYNNTTKELQASLFAGKINPDQYKSLLGEAYNKKVDVNTIIPGGILAPGNYNAQTGAYSAGGDANSVSSSGTTDQQIQAAYKANPSLPQTLNSDVMSPGAPSNFQTNPSGFPTFPLTDTTGLSETQKADQGVRNELMKINESLAGQGAFRQEQENAQNIQALEQSKRDLTAQLKTLENERTAIGYKVAEPGQTAAMLGAQQRELLTQNGIKAWGVAAQLDAANGNLQAAYDKVDKMVEAKYGDIERRAKILKENLNIIEDSPAYKADEKRQAAELKKKLDDEEKLRDVSRDVTSQINKFLLDPQFQTNAPPSVKRQINDLALKQNLTQTDLITAANLASRYTVNPTSPGSIPAGNKLTLSEVTKFGLPTSLVGKTEQQIGQDLSSSTPASWFRSEIENRLQQSLTPQKLQQEWEKFRTSVSSGAQSSSQGTLSTLDFNNL